MKNLTKQKISFRIYEPLLVLVNNQFENLPISRDAFLNNLINTECGYLENELKNTPPLSPTSKRYIQKKLNATASKEWEGTKQINIVVSVETAKRLNEIVLAKNLVRDAFLNRIFLFLLSPPNMFKGWFGPRIDARIDIESCSKALRQELEPLEVSPLKFVAQSLQAPFLLLRASLKSEGCDENGLYLHPLPDKYVGFTCYMEERETPGTSEFKKDSLALAKMLSEF